MIMFLKTFQSLVIGFLVISSASTVRGVEDCGDQCFCAYDGGYGCAQAQPNAPVGAPLTLVCCSAGQNDSDCNSTTNPLPGCPYGPCTGSGCIRLPDADTHKDDCAQENGADCDQQQERNKIKENGAGV
eukprot:scpid6214/ scgid7752/ 